MNSIGKMVCEIHNYHGDRRPHGRTKCQYCWFIWSVMSKWGVKPEKKKELVGEEE